MTASARLRSLFRHFAPLAVAAAIVASCTGDGATPLAPGTDGTLRLSLLPTAASAITCAAADPISRIRLTAVRDPGGDTIHTQTFDVPPAADTWQLTFEIQVTADLARVVVFMELFNAAGAVQCSGMTAPITVDPSRVEQAAPVDLFDGPADNLRATAVTITTAAPSLLEGDSVQLAATVAGPGAPRVSWRSLDADVATVDADGMVRLRRNGSARIVAQAGFVADTITITAGQRAASVRITQASLTAASLGDEPVFTAEVLDPRGAVIPGAAVNWSIDDAAIAEPLGAGRFRALANGSAIVRATSATNAAATATAALIVQQQPASVAVTPGSFVFTAVGLSSSFTAQASDARGNPIPAAAITWSSSADAIVTVSAAGVATARAAGEADVIARAGTAEGRAGVRVTQAPARMSLTPGELLFEAVGDEAALTAQAFDTNDNLIADAAPAWTSSDPAVATVDGAGRVHALASGTATITATLGGVTASADVTVRQRIATLNLAVSELEANSLGQEVTFHALALDGNGNTVPDATLVWSTGHPSIVRSAGGGVFVALAPGLASVRVSAPDAGLEANGFLRVQQVPVRVVVAPAGFAFSGIGVTAQFTAEVQDELGSAIPGAAVTWSSSAPAVVEVDDAGLATSRANGSAVITATASNGVAGSAHVTVARGVDRIEIVPSAVTLPRLGATADLSVQAFDGAGSPIAVPAHTWSTSDAAVATVSAAGRVTATGYGSATITATAADGLTATASISVPRPGLTVEPASLTFVSLGSSQQLVATITDGAGAPVPDAAVTFASANEAVATVDAAGTVTSGEVGETTVTVTYQGEVVTVPVAVRQDASNILVTPSTLTLDIGETGALTVVATDAAGTPIVGATPAFTSRNTAVATVSHDGVVTGVHTGETGILVVVGELSYTVDVTVTNEGALLPDLFVEEVSLSSGTTLVVGEASTVTVRIRSEGAAAPAGSGRVVIYDAGNGLPIVDAVFPHPAIEAGGSVEIQRPLLAQPQWPEAVYAVITVDHVSEIPESDEENNGYRFPGGDGVIPVEGTFEIPEDVTTVWVGSGSAMGYAPWDVASNWSTGQVPGPGDVVLIRDCAYFGLEDCTYPYLTGDVTVAGVRTGFVYDPCPAGGAARGFRSPRVAPSSCNGPTVMPGQGRVGPRQPGMPPTLLDLAPTARAARALSSSEGGFHIDLNGNALRVNGAMPDYTYIGSIELPGDLILGGTDGDAVRGTFATVVSVPGHVELQMVYILGDLDISGRVEGSAEVDGSISVLPDAVLQPDGYFHAYQDVGVAGHLRLNRGALYVNDDLYVSGPDGGAAVDIDEWYLYVGETLSIENGSVEVSGFGALEVNDRIRVEGPNSILELLAGTIAVGFGHYPEDVRLASTRGAGVTAAASNHNALVVHEGGRLSMQDGSGWLDVSGNAVIDGGSTAGLLTAGTLYLRGNLEVGSSPYAYVPSGEHVTGFGYAYETYHQVSFAAPGLSDGASHLHDVEIGNYSGMEFVTPAFATGGVSGHNYVPVTGAPITVMGDLNLANPDMWQLDGITLYGSYFTGSEDHLRSDLTLRGSFNLPYGFNSRNDVTVQGTDVFVQLDYNGEIEGDLVMRDGATFTLSNAELAVRGAVTTLNGGMLRVSHEDSFLDVTGLVTLNGAGAASGYGEIKSETGLVAHQAGTFADDNTITVHFEAPSTAPAVLDVGPGNVIGALELSGNTHVLMHGDVTVGLLHTRAGSVIRHAIGGKIMARNADIMSLALREGIELIIGSVTEPTQILVNGLNFDEYPPALRRLAIGLAGQTVSLTGLEYGDDVFPAAVEGSALVVEGTGTVNVTSATMSHADASSRIDAPDRAVINWNGDVIGECPVTPAFVGTGVGGTFGPADCMAAGRPFRRFGFNIEGTSTLQLGYTSSLPGSLVVQGPTGPFAQLAIPGAGDTRGGFAIVADGSHTITLQGEAPGTFAFSWNEDTPTGCVANVMMEPGVLFNGEITATDCPVVVQANTYHDDYYWGWLVAGQVYTFSVEASGEWYADVRYNGSILQDAGAEGGEDDPSITIAPDVTGWYQFTVSPYAPNTFATYEAEFFIDTFNVTGQGAAPGNLRLPQPPRWTAPPAPRGGRR